MIVQAPANDICGFCEALLKLAWPGRRVAVTPAPIPEVVQSVFETRGVLDVLVGPISADNPAWVCFHAFLNAEVAKGDWLAVGAALLRQAQHEFDLWPTRAATGLDKPPKVNGPSPTGPRAATLLDVLVDGFEKNEVVGGYHERQLPMPDEDSARAKFLELMDEAERWKGRPLQSNEADGVAFVAWKDLELSQAGRAILVRAKAPGFDAWWHDDATWEGAPFETLSK